MNEKHIQLNGATGRIILSELAPKGKVYIIIEKCTQQNLNDLIDLATSYSIEAGATEIFLTLKETSIKLSENEIITNQFHYPFLHTIEEMEILSKKAPTSPTIILQEINEHNAPLFLKLYNEIFFHVPNGATYGEDEIPRLLNKLYFKCFIAFQDHTALGISEISFEEKIPQISSFGILTPFHGVGLGKDFLFKILNELADLQYPNVFLKVSSMNIKAKKLYETVGFVKTKECSRWYALCTDIL